MAIIGADPSAILKDFVRLTGGCAIIDGGLATELEANGADLNDPLWSAKCLISSPELIRKVHLDYLEAGADILITASYQATVQGFQSKGLSAEQSADLLRKSVKVACEARDIFYQKHVKQVILIAASIGSYGAYLADGSEYSGDYGDDVNIEWLKNFHRERVQILSESGADLLAFETIPNKLEAQAYAELLEEDDISIPAWFAFNSKDGINVVSGDSLSECISVAEKCTKVAAVGINCTPPRFIHGLLLSIQKVTTKPILIYPNSGEMYDPDAKEWVETTGESDEDFVSYVTKWREDGACLIGGCCRTTPNTIRAIARALGTHLMMQIEDDDIKFGVLLKQGAEARVFESNFIGRKSIVKERFSKKYRHPVLDSKLTLKRLNAEARCMIKAKKLGVLTPALYAVDSLLQTLTFEYIEGSSVKDVLLGFGSYGVDPEKLADMAMEIGCAVAKLHDGGLVHGDLTTSNMIVQMGTGRLVLIDFGLSFTSTLPEDKAVDLYVLERALLSMHSSCGNVMDQILSVYRKSSKQWSATFNKLAQVRQRGRKRAMIG